MILHVVTKVLKSLVTMLKLDLLALKFTDMGLSGQNNDFTCGN